MPSARKRNKGKERKAKQALIKQEKDRVRINRLWQGWLKGSPPKRNRPGIIVQCEHGFYDSELTDSDDHPVANFMDAFFINWHDKEMCVLQIVQCLFQSHRGVYSSDEYRNMAVKILTRIGTNMLLTEQNGGDISNALSISVSIIALENYVGTGDITDTLNSRVVASKCRDIDPDASSCKREALKFYSKRISCSCLKKKYLEARKTIPKNGLCFGCDVEKERASLSVCSRCMVIQFCSRECQVANWSRHKRDCDLILMCSDNQQHKHTALEVGCMDVIETL